MKSGLKLLLVAWASVSVASLAGFLYLLPGYVIVGAFTHGFKTSENPELKHWFHTCEIGLIVGVSITAWLWRTHRKHYGSFWKST